MTPFVPGPDRRRSPSVRSLATELDLAIAIADQMPLAEVKNRLSEVVDEVEREHGRVVITKHGRRAAAVLGVEDLESLEETLDIVGSDRLPADVRKSLAELAEGAAMPLSKEEALRLAGSDEA